MYVVVVWSRDSFDCSILLNRVELITQTKPDQTRGKEEKSKRRKRGFHIEKSSFSAYISELSKSEQC